MKLLKKSQILRPMEELHAKELAELDASNPSWDHQMVYENAAFQLHRGIEISKVRAILGEKAVLEAQLLLESEEWRNKHLSKIQEK